MTIAPNSPTMGVLQKLSVNGGIEAWVRNFSWWGLAWCGDWEVANLISLSPWSFRPCYSLPHLLPDVPLSLVLVNIDHHLNINNTQQYCSYIDIPLKWLWWRWETGENEQVWIGGALHPSVSRLHLTWTHLIPYLVLNDLSIPYQPSSPFSTPPPVSIIEFLQMGSLWRYYTQNLIISTFEIPSITHFEFTAVGYLAFMGK